VKFHSFLDVPISDILEPIKEDGIKAASGTKRKWAPGPGRQQKRGAAEGWQAQLGERQLLGPVCASGGPAGRLGGNGSGTQTMTRWLCCVQCLSLWARPARMSRSWYVCWRRA
jgi:hypothetical protein